MKIVQINAVYGTLSTGKITRDIHRALLNKNHESYVFWGTACKTEPEDKNIFRIGNTLDHKIHALLYRLDKRQGWHSRFATYNLCKKLKKISPDVVHLHNLHSNYISLPILLRFLANHQIPTLLTIHDCWFFTGICYHYKALNCFKWQNNCTDCKACSNNRLPERLLNNKKELFGSINKLALNGVSKWTTDAASKSILSCAVIKRHIYNWIDTETFSPLNCRKDVIKKYNLPCEKKIILGVSQGWSINKGLNEFIEIANQLKDEAVVVLVGENSEIPKESGIKAIGFTNSAKELAELYSAADIFVNPSKAETFGLVTVEAMACGTPVVAYANTGSLELILEECGKLAKDENSDALVKAVNEILCIGKEKYRRNCRDNAIKRFSKEKQIGEYMKLYNDLIHYNEKRDTIK